MLAEVADHSALMPANDRLQPGQYGGGLRHGPLLRIIIERVIAQRSTLGMRIKDGAIPVGTHPFEHREASRGGHDGLLVDVGVGLAPLGCDLQAGNAPSLGKQAGFGAPRAVASNLV